MTNDFRDPRLRFGMALSQLARHWRRMLDENLARDQRFAGVSLTGATWAPLIYLHELGDGVSQKDLAKRVGIDGSSLVRLIDSLVDQGLAERRSSDADRRVRQIFLTNRGREVVDALRAHLTHIELDILDVIDDRDMTTVLQSFSMIEARLDDPDGRK